MIIDNKVTHYKFLPENDLEWDNLAYYLFYNGIDRHFIQDKFYELSRYKKYLFGKDLEYKNTPVNISNKEFLVKKFERKEKLEKLYER